LREIGPKRNCFAQPGGRAAAQRNRAIGLPLSRHRQCLLRDGDRSVHGRFREGSDAELTKSAREIVCLDLLLRRRKNEGASAIEKPNLIGHFVERAESEQNLARQPGVDKRVHDRSSQFSN
jgi:hypothetical protein